MISEKDKGLYDAWNKGIALAKGEWILFVGAGDLLSEDALMNYLFFLIIILSVLIIYLLW